MISKRIKLIPLLLIAALVGVAAPAWAGYEITRIPTDTVQNGTPGLGAGLLFTRDVYIGQERTPDVIPLYIYEGRWIFANGTSGGIHFLKEKNYHFDALVRWRFDEFEPERVDGLQGIKPRNQTLDAGVSGGILGNWGAIKVEYVTDVKNRHDGNQLDISYRKSIDMGAFSLSPFITFSFLDSNLADYYYGISEDESEASGLPAYAPGASENISIGISTSWQITDHVFAFGNLGFRFVDRNIQNSPLVTGDIGPTGFIGGGYFFGPVKDSKYVDPERSGEWSWRVNYGYTGNTNIAPKPMQGYLPKSEKINTNIAGFTLGKLLQGGKRVDIYGKLAAFRHLEEPHQENFWSYSAYVMAIGKGYLPWSEKLAFRWGFGMGGSYAQQIPMIEQIKQEERDRTTSKFLNYLEFMVDFPIDRVIKSKLTKGCFVGLVVVHRSGIFSASDILGEVGGGSDWYTLSLECVR